MHSTSSLKINHTKNFINFCKLQKASWKGNKQPKSSSTEKSNRKSKIINFTLIILIIFLVSTIISLIFLLSYYINQIHQAKTQTVNLNLSTLKITDGLNKKTNKICLSEECVKSAAYLLERIDFNVNPCENFYEFACGKFIRSHAVPDDHTSRNILQDIQDDIYVEMKNYLEEKISDEDKKDDSDLVINKKFINWLEKDSKVSEKITDSKNSSSSLEKNIIENKNSSELNAVKKVKLFYRSCMNESTINDEPVSVNVILNLIQDYGGKWNLLSKSSLINKTMKVLDSVQNLNFKFDNETNLENKLEKRFFSVFLHQIQPIFHFYVAQQESKKNLKDYAIHLFSGSTILESSYFNNTTSSNKTRKNYQSAYVYLQLEILNKIAAVMGRSINSKEAIKHIEKVVAFESDLANITKTYSEATSYQNEIFVLDKNTSKSVSNVTNKSNLHVNQNHSEEPTLNQKIKTSYIKIHLNELKTKYDFFNWEFFFKMMQGIAKQEINEILVEDIEYLDEIKVLFTKYDKEVIDNYLCWATIARFLPYLGLNFRRVFTDFRRKIPEPVTNEFKLFDTLFNKPEKDVSRRKRNSLITGRMFLSRWKECIYLTSEGLKVPTAMLYLKKKKFLIQEISKQVNVMVENIKEAFFQIIDKQVWLKNNDIKKIVKKRAETIKSKIGFPQYLIDLESADKQFVDLDINPDDVFVANIIKMVRHEMINELKLLNEKIDEDKDWLIEPLIPNAYYDSVNHFIILPVAILREPLINFKRPKYLDYSTLGVIIGHEIAHAFDTGAKKEINNLIFNNVTINDFNTTLWSKNLNKEYEKKTKCFVQQFNNYSVDEINEKLNGSLTLEENICDFAGLQQAFTAYTLSKTESDDVLLPGLTQLNPNQLFFVQYAQVWCEISNKDGYLKSVLDSHAPGKFRANGVVSNSKQYSQAFNCQYEDSMNLKNKCDLWAY